MLLSLEPPKPKKAKMDFKDLAIEVLLEDRVPKLTYLSQSNII